MCKPLFYLKVKFPFKSTFKRSGFRQTHCRIPGERIEKWQAQRSCPSGFFLTTATNKIHFLPTAESYASWHDGQPFAESSGEALDRLNSSDAAPSGVYEAESGYGQRACRMLVELNRAPSAGNLPPHIRLHMLSCGASSTVVRAHAAPPQSPLAPTKSEPEPDPEAHPSSTRQLRRSLQDPVGAEASAAVEVRAVNLSAPLTAFVASNASRSVLASFTSLTVPAADGGGGPTTRYWLIVAADAAAISESALVAPVLCCG